jgi:hypothetical protein
MPKSAWGSDDAPAGAEGVPAAIAKVVNRRELDGGGIEYKVRYLDAALTADSWLPEAEVRPAELIEKFQAAYSEKKARRKLEKKMRRRAERDTAALANSMAAALSQAGLSRTDESVRHIWEHVDQVRASPQAWVGAAQERQRAKTHRPVPPPPRAGDGVAGSGGGGRPLQRLRQPQLEPELEPGEEEPEEPGAGSLVQLDADGDGSLDVREVSAAMDLGTAETELIMQLMDKNGDGKLSAEEWDAEVAYDPEAEQQFMMMADFDYTPAEEMGGGGGGDADADADAAAALGEPPPPPPPQAEESAEAAQHLQARAGEVLHVLQHHVPELGPGWSLWCEPGLARGNMGVVAAADTVSSASFTHEYMRPWGGGA